MHDSPPNIINKVNKDVAALEAALTNSPRAQRLAKVERDDKIVATKMANIKEKLKTRQITEYESDTIEQY